MNFYPVNPPYLCRGRPVVKLLSMMYYSRNEKKLDGASVTQRTDQERTSADISWMFDNSVALHDDAFVFSRQ